MEPDLTVAQFVLRQEVDSNGNGSLVLSQMTLTEALQVINELEELTHQSFVIEVWGDKSFQVNMKGNDGVDKVLFVVNEGLF